ncbi:DNA-binding transcriptional regulator, AcrR family [Friedmanniella luteola]|uniref:DNA-binding transcriptional regulator, AcrR family n=1 Tax=Friedmanniella luteola TaxID=546871 RepID=A0A1H1RJT5_9ACTN|nr:TetR/AcrR family transcriptional regulator [Friedmanniella luteola]SDS35942.1 DNA-binding transcriptional regulator, AcrR family [Friedmanniella luteola]
MAEAVVRGAGRPRDVTVDAAVLRATQDLLLEQGFDRLSVEGVAARAGVAKATIYRRWPGKTALVVAAVAELYHVPPVPDTGDLREDLLACGRTYVHQGRTQAVLAGLMTAMVHEDELRTAATAAIGGPYTALFHQVISRAVERGEAQPDTDVTSVSEVFPALAFHRGAALGLAVDEQMVVRVVDRLLLPLLR